MMSYSLKVTFSKFHFITLWQLNRVPPESKSRKIPYNDLLSVLLGSYMIKHHCFRQSQGFSWFCDCSVSLAQKHEVKIKFIIIFKTLAVRISLPEAWWRDLGLPARPGIITQNFGKVQSSRPWDRTTFTIRKQKLTCLFYGRQMNYPF
jgi:hypothetical protein